MSTEPMSTEPMSTVPNDIALAWQANAAINDALLAHLEPEMLHAITPGAGYSVAQHLAHMVECLKGWSSRLNAATMEVLPDLYSNYDHTTGLFDAEHDLSRIQAVMIQTRDQAMAVAQTAEGTGTLPHATVGKFLVHMLAHDAHHRGQILLALKVNGHALPDDELLWLPWRS
jgi:uncharacterized damage-inducible protein DinB